MSEPLQDEVSRRERRRVTASDVSWGVRDLQRAQDERTALLRDAELHLRELKAEFARTEREHRLFREQFRGMLRAYERSLDSVPDVLALEAQGS